ncbi:hypothetical protein EGW08_022853 [Elysia chlorotica]|uniref:Uncharacterized protein n=1 Tax=Elysia chlorotica TaxID=188477 RepID=A0A3S0Z4T0_ELYCH|nr:hypothetical protein EGW08_022853 [Elysia chlorotica]
MVVPLHRPERPLSWNSTQILSIEPTPRPLVLGQRPLKQRIRRVTVERRVRGRNPRACQAPKSKFVIFKIPAAVFVHRSARRGSHSQLDQGYHCCFYLFATGAMHCFQTDWNPFVDLCFKSINASLLDTESPADTFTEKILEAVRASIPFHKTGEIGPNPNPNPNRIRNHGEEGLLLASEIRTVRANKFQTQVRGYEGATLGDTVLTSPPSCRLEMKSKMARRGQREKNYLVLVGWLNERQMFGLDAREVGARCEDCEGPARAAIFPPEPGREYGWSEELTSGSL